VQTALIFGASGQDAHYLAELCGKRGIKSVSCSRSVGPWIQCNVADYGAVKDLIHRHEPAYIFHLAADSTTRHDALFENHSAISTGTLNILESARLHAPHARIFLTGSGVQFKNRERPISENDEFEASSPYALARIHSVYAGRYYRALGLRVYAGYLFHHESPLRKPTHVSKTIADAALRIANGSNEIIKLGDLSVEKEWTFAGDIVEGIFTLINQDHVFEATIGSGNVYSIQNWLDACFGLIKLDWRDHVKLDDAYVPEYRRLVCNPTTLHKLGWQPKVGFDELARMMMGTTGAKT
jgi:GDPmannose 4,6-dehydratase